MTAYVSSNPRSLFASAQIDEANGKGFFVVKNEGDIDAAKQVLKSIGQECLAQSAMRGQTVIVTQSSDAREAALAKLAKADGGNFEPAQPEKGGLLQFLRKNGWKLRGGSSVVGQSMTLFSAFKSVSKENADAGKLTPKFDPATGAFATLNLAANFVNYIFGGQKEKDTFGLQKFDEIIADEVNRFAPGKATTVQASDVKKTAYMTQEELQEHKKESSPMGILKRNSVRLGEVGLRTLGSICMVVNYRQVVPALSLLMKGQFKQAVMTAKVQDKGTFLAGLGMVAGKIMGLSAKTYDPNNPPKTYIEEIRQKVLWITSSFTEMFAQSSVAYDRYKNKRLVLGGKAHQDVTGIVGNVILTVPPYPTRLVLPYGKKVLDVNEVQARLMDELPKLPADKIPDVVARVTARMVEHMGEDASKFAELYTGLMRKLETFKHIRIAPQVQAISSEPEMKTNFAEKLGKRDTKSDLKPGALREILDAEANSASLSPAGAAR